jgi:hypothetical protein
LLADRIFDAYDMAFSIDIVNERPGLFRPLDLAAPDSDVHRVGFGIVSYVGHGFRLAFRSNIALIRACAVRITGFFIGFVSSYRSRAIRLSYPPSAPR